MTEPPITDPSVAPGTFALHGADADVGELASLVTAFIEQRLRCAPLGATATVDEMDALLAGAITEGGLGSQLAWELLTDVILPRTIGIDSERFLAFIPSSPSVAAAWIDAIVGATSLPAESWLEAAGAVAAENQLLRLLADLAGMPPTAGGCFMSGGSIGNLSALAVARDQQPNRRLVAIADTAHASVHNTLHLLGLDALVVPTGTDGRFRGDDLRAELQVHPEARARIGVIVAAAGSTNAGVIDDLDGIADVASELGAWFHVDGAYGAATLLLPELSVQFRGIARADSFIVDPHKWLFAPSGSCALVYRDPSLAAAVHTQHGPYVEVFRANGDEWNPADFGFQLTRRAAGLPLWFSMVLHGTAAFADAIRAGIDLARYAANALRDAPHVALVMEPELSVVLFRRDGWDRDRWRAWAQRLLADGTAFVAPTAWRGEPVGRLVFLHPHTPRSLIDEIVSSLNTP